MTNIIVEIPEKIQKNYFGNNKNNLELAELFAIFGIDLEFLLKEKKYSNEFLKDIKNGNYTINNKF